MTPVLDDHVVDALRQEIAGLVITPAGAGYAEARTVFNAMIDRRPAVIAQCAHSTDVAAAIRFARANGLEVAVRGGGHGVAGTALVDDGLVVDLRRMNEVRVDPDARLAVVGGGATMSDLDRACQPHGLATTGGRVSTTGVGGFALGGGTGWMDRMFGIACDNLEAVDLITADGTLVPASAQENPDLFWALHGGGGNFGVATSLTLRLYPLPVTTLGMLMWSPEHGSEVTRLFRDLIESGPNELSGGLIHLTGPEGEDFVPEHLVNRLACTAVIVYAGGEADARQAVAPLLDLHPEGTMIAEMPYADLQCALDDPPGYRNYWSAEHLDTFPDAAVDAFCSSVSGMVVPSPSQHVLFPLGAPVSADDYPIPWRSSPWIVHPFGLWDDPGDDARAIQWTRDVRAAVRPWSSGAVYLNFIGDEGAERTNAGLGEENLARLATVKAEFDPDNVFHLNHNIKPALRP